MRSTKIICLFFFLVVIEGGTRSFAQGTDSTSTNDSRTRQLKELSAQFKQFQAANKNSQALEVLQRYGQLNTARLQDLRLNEISALEHKFNVSSQSRKTQLASIRKETATLEQEIASLETSRQSLATRTFLFFVTLGGLILLILFIRNRILRKVTGNLELAQTLQNELEQILQQSQQRESERRQLIGKVVGFNQKLEKHMPQLEKIADDKTHTESKVVRQLLADSSQSSRILSGNSFNSVAETPGKTNLNHLIRDVSRLAYEEYNRTSPDFTCELIFDLESILPEVEVYTPQLQRALYCLVSNSLDSLHRKSGDAPKGFQPKITITSRKLPRFVQVRIRDNGAGIPEQILSQTEGFPAGNNTQEQILALGMQEARRVILQLHKGELLFESESGAQSDAIIRFQTHSLQ